MTRLHARGFVPLVVCLGVLLVCPALAARPDKPLVGARATGPRASSKVLGVVWNADSSPVPNARVRLRNLQTGRVDATGVANQAGQFTFENLENGSYVIEFVDEGGRIRALGQSFRIDNGETIATFVRLAARQPWFAGFFDNAAAAAITAASSAGVTAVGSDAPAVTPR
jgi:hypothetical protein